MVPHLKSLTKADIFPPAWYHETHKSNTIKNMTDFSLKNLLLQEFAGEMATTRKILERVPFEKSDWTPHEKSMPLGRLAIHIASIAGMGADIIRKDSLSFDGPRPQAEIRSTPDLLKLLDENIAATEAALRDTADAHLAESWTLRFGDRIVFSGLRAQALRTLMMNHLIHHRAQLGVYLRINGVLIPGSYGPSADEPIT